jgi:pimeloyl-ACP methyl ester carboxylesterase
VQKAGDQVRVNVELINAQTDADLWADSYDRKLTDILGVETGPHYQHAVRSNPNNISKLIDSLPEKPLIIGHSMAGMATLKLVEMGKASAGVSIDGAPPKNVFPPFQTLKTVLPAFGFFSFNKYFMGSRKWYDYAFFNTIPGTEKEKAFEKFAVPESYKVSRQLVLNSFANIDFKKPHAPILFIGGGSDHIFPPNLTKTIAGRYKDTNSQVLM